MRVEEALRQAQKMEAVGQLTGGIAHDFNNLLTPIMGGLELISRQLSDARLKRIAEAGLESARRGAKLTGQLLAFSRLQRIEMAPVAVNKVIEQMQTLLRHSIGSEIRVETSLSEEPYYGICDANQLENAILNLAINARDAMPEGGRLTISTRLCAQLENPDLAPGDYLCISVADTGHGMPADVVERAAEPFFSTKPLGKGTGLGLAQVYGIAKQSGGALRIESEAGRGTRVSMLIPRAENPEPSHDAAQAAEHGSAAARKACRILVVDDDGDVRDFLVGALRDLGHDVVEAGSGEQALRLLGERPAELALVDYAMPGMNGAELAGRLRAEHPALPIVFVTGYAESDQLERALGGGVPLLRKPFTIGELAAAVDENRIREDPLQSS